MRTLPAITGKLLIKALKKIGFDVVRSKSSHHFLLHPDGRYTVVPIHAGETIGRGLLAQIMRDCEITSEDLKESIMNANKQVEWIAYAYDKLLIKSPMKRLFRKSP